MYSYVLYVHAQNIEFGLETGLGVDEQNGFRRLNGLFYLWLPNGQIRRNGEFCTDIESALPRLHVSFCLRTKMTFAGRTRRFMCL